MITMSLLFPLCLCLWNSLSSNYVFISLTSTPRRVIRSGSPPNLTMFLLIHSRPTFTSFSPRFTVPFTYLGIHIHILTKCLGVHTTINILKKYNMHFVITLIKSFRMDFEYKKNTLQPYPSKLG